MYNLWFIAMGLAAVVILLIVLWVKGMDDSAYFTDRDDFFGCTTFLISALLIAFIIVSIINPAESRAEVNALISEGETLQNLMDNRVGLDKLSVTERVIEYNRKVSELLGKIKAWGRWSPYYFTDYELLKTIEI